MRISDVIGTKASKDVITIAPDATVRDLIRLLDRHNVGALIVSTDGILDGAVSAIMTVEVATAAPDTSLDEMRALMTERRIRHVPVVKDGRLTGIISIGDVVKAAMDQLQFERDHLDTYLHQT